MLDSFLSLLKLYISNQASSLASRCLATTSWVVRHETFRALTAIAEIAHENGAVPKPALSEYLAFSSSQFPISDSLYEHQALLRSHKNGLDAACFILLPVSKRRTSQLVVDDSDDEVAIISAAEKRPRLNSVSEITSKEQAFDCAEKGLSSLLDTFNDGLPAGVLHELKQIQQRIQQLREQCMFS